MWGMPFSARGCSEKNRCLVQWFLNMGLTHPSEGTCGLIVAVMLISGKLEWQTPAQYYGVLTELKTIFTDCDAKFQQELVHCAHSSPHTRFFTVFWITPSNSSTTNSTSICPIALEEITLGCQGEFKCYPTGSFKKGRRCNDANCHEHGWISASKFYSTKHAQWQFE